MEIVIQQITVRPAPQQLAVVDAHAAKTRQNRAAVVRLAIDRMAILDAVKPDEYAGIVAGLKVLEDK